jgi:hypothetical protein
MCEKHQIQIDGGIRVTRKGGHSEPAPTSAP